MGKFETKEQVIGLFLGAAGVAALLMLLVTAEARSRVHRSPEIAAPTAADSTFLDRISHMLRPSEENHEESHGFRRKRSVDIIAEDMDKAANIAADANKDVSKNRDSKQSDEKKKSKDLKLTEKLVEAQAAGHKIRHLGEKVKQLGSDSDLVQAVLKVYCSKETYFRTQFVNCTEATRQQQQQHQQLHQQHEQRQQKQQHQVHQQQQQEHHHQKQKQPLHQQQHLQNQPQQYHQQPASEQEDPLVSGKEHHQPLLEEDVFHDMKPDKQRQSQGCGVREDCSSHTWVVVTLTTLFNTILFAMIYSSYTLIKFISNRKQPEDKIWLCEDDDISSLREEQVEPRVGQVTMVA